MMTTPPSFPHFFFPSPSAISFPPVLCYAHQPTTNPSLPSSSCIRRRMGLLTNLLLLSTQWQKVSFEEACRHSVAGMDCHQLRARPDLISVFTELPRQDNEYIKAYTEHGTQLVYLEDVFRQWYIRMMREISEASIPLFTLDILRPTSLLQRHIDHVLAFYDRHLTIGTRVIGLHLRIEDDMPPIFCGRVSDVVDRLCNQFQIGCASATCIVATGAPRWSYEHDLPCRAILTKEQAWSSDSSNAPILEREEAAIVDLFTVTRAHLFTGCGFSTFSAAGMALHPIRLSQWIASSQSHDIAASILTIDTGEVQYGSSWAKPCSHSTQIWIDNHGLSQTTRQHHNASCVQ
jgi:hypothetical protein